MHYLLSTLTFISLLILFSCGRPETADQTTGEAQTAGQESQVRGEEITYTAGETNMKGYIAYDPSSEEKRPGILVVHEWWGHNDYARKRAEMLADLGYVALAVDMYGDGKQADHPEDAAAFSGKVMSDFVIAQERFLQAMQSLKANPMTDTSKIGAIGYCFGGSVVLSMANAGLDLDAVAAFHSGVSLPVWPEDSLETHILVCNGADDPFITEDQVEEFKEEMEEAHADYTYISYEGAKHSFTNPDADKLGKKFNMPVAYNAKADSASWEAMKDLFNRSF